MALHLPVKNGAGPRDPFQVQLKDFVESIQTKSNPAVDGRQALNLIQLIERCYAEAERIPEPWLDISETPREVRR